MILYLLPWGTDESAANAMWFSVFSLEHGTNGDADTNITYEWPYLTASHHNL